MSICTYILCIVYVYIYYIYNLAFFVLGTKLFVSLLNLCLTHEPNIVSTRYIGLVFLFRSWYIWVWSKMRVNFCFSLCQYLAVLAELVEIIEMLSQVN
jgi:hypothetical protein